MSTKIKHSGIVDSVTGDCVKVRILQSSACSACKVAAHCHASETKEKIVEVTHVNPGAYSCGEHVVVMADTSVGFRASWYGYLLPLILMVLALVLVLRFCHSEGVAALSSLGILIPYYLILYFFRGKLKNNLSFELEK